MTGPQHYKRAEELIATADARLEECVGRYGEADAVAGFHMAMDLAKVHATLALAAATIEATAQAASIVSSWVEALA